MIFFMALGVSREPLDRTLLEVLFDSQNYIKTVGQKSFVLGSMDIFRALMALQTMVMEPSRMFCFDQMSLTMSMIW